MEKGNEFVDGKKEKDRGITKRSYICVNLNSHLQKEPITKIKDI